MGKLIPNAFNLGVVIFVALGSTACSYGMAIIGSTIGQPSFYTSLGLAPQGQAGYARTAEYIGAFNGNNYAAYSSRHQADAVQVSMLPAQP